jgi:nucleoside-diphosphate-sugar epimerase
MKLAVTGALGHIGSAFIRSLTGRQYDEVLLIDNLMGERYSSLFDLPRDVPFRFVQADIRSADLRSLFKGFDTVLHLAAITNAAESFGIADLVHDVNFNGTARVAEACRDTRSKMLFLSTTSVYGTQLEVVDENCPASDLKPQSPYATSKLQAEALLERMGQDGLEFVTVRFGTVFGKSIGMRFHTAINKFCWQASVGQPISVWRTALHQRRPYLHVGDAVRAMHLLLGWQKFDNRLYNVVTSNATVNDIIEIIKTQVEDVRVELVDSKIMNQLSYTVLADRFAARGFKFQGDLRSGVVETLDLLKALHGRSVAAPPVS